MKKMAKIIFSVFLSICLAASPSFGSVLAYSASSKHWYYSDELMFKYWGLTEVNEYGIPLSADVMNRISFNGMSPAAVYQEGKENYVITAYIDSAPITFNARICKRGDVDGNGDLDLYDNIKIAEFLLDPKTFTDEFYEFAADYDANGIVNIYDAIGVAEYLIQKSLSDQYYDNLVLSQFVNEVLAIVNNERTSAGLSKLVIDDKLCRAAQQRAKEISTQPDIEHTRPDGSSCFTVLSEMNIEYQYAGENIAGGYTTPTEVVEAWMASENHRRNILDPYFEKIGIGFYKKENTTYTYYWSQFFIQE